MRRETRNAVNLGFPVLLHALAGSVVLTVDRTALQILKGAAEVGRYQIAYALGMGVTVLLVAFNNAWAPAVFKFSDESRWLRHSFVARNAGATCCLTLGVMLLLEEPTLRLLGVTADAVSFRVATVFMVCAIPQVVYLYGLNALYWLGRTKEVAGRTVSILGIQLVLSLLLIPSIGMWGPAVALLISQIAQAGSLYRLATKKYGLPSLGHGTHLLLLTSGFVALGVTASGVTGVGTIAAGLWIVTTSLASVGSQYRRAPTPDKARPERGKESSESSCLS
jgi:O-antigen/teichoic acid export membrane protein